MAPSATAFLAILGAVATLVVAGALYIEFQGSWSTTVTDWHPGSATVSGDTTNGTHDGCSAAEVTLHLYDHNDALVREFSFGLGEMPAGAHRHWTTQMVGLLDIPQPAEATVVRITADAACTDRH